ncbi:DUF4159 domain-containing protein [Marinivivus vitaminiproducens]|uniref:DUF4159 domain-containing protein n=1 Tax=Marinivivus vitaminiproducens TaxID=3035935 RepID=UPI0027A766CB|nr:DUF4159 domain-containing protein [Geminicoccaceae bacterium SCSIO 64248]
MLSLGVIGFTQAWLLAGLALLPAIWWLLRTTPPAPRRLRFPALLLLLGLGSREETPARTPLWLLVMRMVLAALLILALAGPVLNPEPRTDGSGPLVLAVDDGWAAAADWPARQEIMQRQAEQAARDGREVVLLATAPDPARPMAERMTAADALARLPDWRPRPWPVDRAAAADAVNGLGLAGADAVWLSDGVADSAEAQDAAGRLADALRGLGGEWRVFAPDAGRQALLLSPPEPSAEILATRLTRPQGGPAATFTVRALGPEGEVLRRQAATFADGATTAEVRFDLPLQLRNRIARLDVEPSRGVGGVVLFDETWRRRVVGLLGAPGGAQPLLSELYYVDRALQPFVEIRTGDVRALLDGEISMAVMPDNAGLDAEERAVLADWIEGGGVLVRFAGPRLAAGEADDDLLPVPLRLGERNLGGVLSWAQPLPLGRFEDGHPLAGLAVPDDVTVRQQVLAQPGPEVIEHSWAELSDGTPLITGARRGDGWTVLVHTTANAAWSNLALSGTFVDMLRRMVELGQGVAGGLQGTLTPIAALDADGRLGDPSGYVQTVDGRALAGTRVGPAHPPGLYGRPGDAEDAPRVALNLAPSVPDLRPLGPEQLRTAPAPYTVSAETSLLPWLLTMALVLALIDMVIGLALRGFLPVGRRVVGTAAAALLLVAALPAMAMDDARVQAAANGNRLAYVVTGVGPVDDLSRAGMEGLTLVLNRRTTVESGEPLAVDLAVDDLSLLPLLYWPVPPEAPDLSPEVKERVVRYLRQGGLILFDTKDGNVLLPGADGPGAQRLRTLLEGVELPALAPVPEDHALTRSFYLLQDFPGRYVGAPVWLDAGESGVNDGVASVIIGGNDWAGAWAIDSYGSSLYPVTPGGERQREMARRFGVNLVMYALTGNYKTDQVHIPALLERLGQ